MAKNTEDLKRVLTISAQKNSDTLDIEHRLQSGPYPSAKDTAQAMKVVQGEFVEKVQPKNEVRLLPTGVRWCTSDRRSLIIEEEPVIRSITFRDGARLEMRRKVRTYDIQLPWVYYGISPDKNKNPYVSQIFASPKQIESLEDPLCILPIPNVFTNGNICTHDLLDMNVLMPYHVRVNQAISEFWASLFNLDVNHYMKSSAYKWLTNATGSLDFFGEWARLKKSQIMRDMPWTTVCYVQQFGAQLIGYNDFFALSKDQAGLFMSNLLVTAMENNVS